MTVMTGFSGNEMLCLALKGFKPGDIVIGNSVHSLGFIGGITSGFRGVMGGEITEITQIIHEMGSLIEFMAIGTAVKRMPGLATVTPTLPPQAVMHDKETWISSEYQGLGADDDDD